MKPLILIGGGGHCKSVIEAAESAGYSILPMFENCENDGLKNTIWFADRVVNIPSSVRL